MKTVPRYGRIELPASSGCAEARLVTPSGRVETALTFDYLPTRLVYDAHGYESDEVCGPVSRRFRYTPETHDILLRGHRGLQAGIAQIQPRPGGGRLLQAGIGGNIQTAEHAAARRRAEGAV